MRHIRINSTVLIVVLIFSCGSGSSKKDGHLDSNTLSEVKLISPVVPTGNYVTADYKNRGRGYDWVSVSIRAIGGEKIGITVRSRPDIKKPTCTLDATAIRVDTLVYKTELHGGEVLFDFTDGNLNIRPVAEKDAAALYFYCSGGASLAGHYIKNEEKIDTVKIASGN